MTVRASTVIATHTQGGFVDFMAWSRPTAEYYKN